MKALIVNSPCHAAFEEVPTPAPRGNEVLAKVVRAGICGTDNAIFTGETSFVRDGLITYPCRFGHEWSGVVEAVGDKVTAFRPGDRIIADNAVSCGECAACREGRYAACGSIKSVGTVNCWDGCFAEYMLIPDYHVYPLADHVSFDQAALIEPLSIAYEGFKALKPGAGGSVAVIGTGPIAMSSVALANYYGAGQIILVGRRDGKLAAGQRVGATHLVNNTQVDAVEAVKKLTGGQGADLVLETSGAEESLAAAIKMARHAGRVEVIGFYEKDIGGVPIDRLVLDTITLHGAAGCYGNAEACNEIMTSADLGLEAVITHRVKFGDCLEYFVNDSRYHNEKIKVMIEFD